MASAVETTNVLHLRPAHPGDSRLKRIRTKAAKPKPMTTAIGFKCEDGVILGADSEISEGWGKHEESKILKLTDDCFFAYAGRSLVVRDNLAAFQLASEQFDQSRIVDGFKTIYLNIWQEARRRESEGELEPFTDFLFVVKDDLFVGKGGDFAPVTFDVIGSGKDVARSTVDFFGTPLSCRQARIVAAYALRQAKEFTQGSGKRSEIWEARRGDDLAFKQAPNAVAEEEIEKDFSFLKGSLRPLFLALPDLEVGPEEFSQLAKDIVARMKHYRKVKFREHEKEARQIARILEKFRKEYPS